MELLIWAGGRWRRVCATSGRVAGWHRRARFVCNRRGILRELPIAKLRTIVKGPRLPKQRIQEAKLKPPPIPESKLHCRYGQMLPPLHKDASVQTDTESKQSTTIPKFNYTVQASQKPNRDTFVSPKSLEDKENVSRPEKRNFRSASTEIIPLSPSQKQKGEEKAVKNKHLKKDTQKGETEQSALPESDEDHYKELIIDEEDVLLLRRYIENHNTNIDLYRYDVDDNYKTLIFFKINPLVKLERCPRIAQMLRDRDDNVTVHFARQLGLRSIDDKDIESRERKTRHSKQAALIQLTRNTEEQRKRKTSPTLISSEEKTDLEHKKSIKKRNTKKEKTNWSDEESDTEDDSDSDVQELRRSKRKSVKDMTVTLSDDEDRTRKIKKRSAKEEKTSLIDDTETNNEGNIKERNNMNTKKPKKCVNLDLTAETDDDEAELSNDDTKKQKRKNTKQSKKDLTDKIAESDDAFDASKDKHRKKTEKQRTDRREPKERKEDVSDNDNDTGKPRKVKNKVTNDAIIKLIKDSNDDETDSNNKESTKQTEKSNNNTKKGKNPVNLDLTVENDDEEAFKTNNKEEKLKNKSNVSTDKGVKAKSSQRVFIELNSERKSSKESNRRKEKKDSDEENLRPKESKRTVFLKKIAVPKRSSVPPGREYSMLEDQAIVAWLSASITRERAVNGNRIWRELQQCYTRLTGQKRSWHSLRNRYLRYILPDLGSLMLPPDHAKRLRAHATLGELKSHKKTRRNSVFHLPAVLSASARATHRNITEKRDLPERSNSSENSELSPPRRPVLRSSLQTTQSPSENTRSRSPNKTRTHHKESNNTHTQSSKTDTQTSKSHTQSNKTDTQSNKTDTQSSKTQAQSSKTQTQPSKTHTESSKKHRRKTPSPTKSQENSSSTGRTRSPNKSPLTKSPRKSSERTKSLHKRRTKSPRSSPTYSELTRRFALRNRSTPKESPEKAVIHHKRRLYNPARMASGGSPST